MNAKKANLVFLLQILCTFVLLFGYVIVNMTTGWEMPIWLNLILSDLVLVLPGLLMVLATRTPLREMFPFHKVRLSTALLTLVFTACVTPLINVLNLFTQLFVDSAGAELAEAYMEYPMIPVILLAGVMAPLGEECVFRGVMYQSYRKTGRYVAGAVASAAAFAMIHMNFNQGAYALFMGICLVALYEATGNLWYTVISHAAVNLSSVLQVYIELAIAPESFDLANNMTEAETHAYLLHYMGVYGILSIGGIVLAVLVIGKMADLEGRREHFRTIWTKPVEKIIPERDPGLAEEMQKPRKPQILSASYIIGAVLALGYMVLGAILV